MGRVYVIMGVCGSGKTTIGRRLAAATGGQFFDGDDFHPPANVAKMQSGTPLTDADRQAWLKRLADLIATQRSQPGWHFLACSALRESYRATLRAGDPALGFIFLHGSPELLQARMAARKNHFMPPGLLDSQFATLEPPADALAVDVSGSEEAIVSAILQALAPAK